MAKTTATKTTTTGAAPEEPTTTQAIATTTRKVSESLATAEGYDQDDRGGKENLDQNDMTLPFLAICQKTSPQLESDNAKYIEGLRFLDLFNTLTGDVYTGNPVEFIPIICRKHAIEFHPFESGGGIKDRSVPWDDDRCEFHGDDKPLATRFYDWIVWLVATGEPIVLSFKSTNVGVAKQFQQILNLRSGPARAGKYTVSTVKASANGNTFGKFVIKPAGKTPGELKEIVDDIFTNISSGKVKVVADHEGMAAEEGRQPGDEPANEGQAPTGPTGNVPF